MDATGVTVYPEPHTSSSEARWLVDALGAQNSQGSPGGFYVGRLVPAGFEAYARILHPARDGDDLVPWSAIAAWSGQQLTARSSSEEILTRADGVRWDRIGVRDRPNEGTSVVFGAPFTGLRRRLAESTATPSSLWVLVSITEHTGLPSGYPGPPDDAGARRGDGGRDPMWRPYDAAFVSVVGEPHFLHAASFTRDTHIDQRPSYWWPSDRSWLVHANEDCPTTYIGGPAELVDAISDDPEIEAFRADLGDPYDGHG